MCTAGRPKREGTPDRYPSTANNPIPQDQSSSAQLYYIVSVALHRPDPLRQPLIGVFGAVHLDVLAMVTGSGDTTDRPERLVQGFGSMGYQHATAFATSARWVRFGLDLGPALLNRLQMRDLRRRGIETAA